MTIIEDLKYRFIFDEIFQASINAAFSTRNRQFPIYNKIIKKSSFLRCELKELLEDYIIRFKSNSINEADQFNEIEKINNVSSANVSHAKLPHQSKFRIDVSQKLLNLILKYLWCMDEISEPIHCPIDAIVKEKFLK